MSAPALKPETVCSGIVAFVVDVWMIEWLLIVERSTAVMTEISMIWEE